MSKFDNVLIQSKKAAEEKKEHHFKVEQERRDDLRSYALIADRDFDGRRNKSVINKPPADYIDLTTASNMTGLHIKTIVALIDAGKVSARKYRGKHRDVTWHIRLIDAQKIADQQRGA